MIEVCKIEQIDQALEDTSMRGYICGNCGRLFISRVEEDKSPHTPSIGGAMTASINPLFCIECPSRQVHGALEI